MTMGKAKSDSETNKLSLGTATFFFVSNTHSPLCDPIISYLGTVLFFRMPTASWAHGDMRWGHGCVIL